MTVKGGRHQLTGMVSLGSFNNAMENIKSSKDLRCPMFYYEKSTFVKDR